MKRLINMDEIKYLNVEVLRKIRYKIQNKIYGLKGAERIAAEEDHAYLSNYITKLEKSAKIHKEFLKKQNKQYKSFNNKQK